MLLCNMLQLILIYMMSAMNPPNRVIDQIHKSMARFFWGRKGGSKGKYWIAWDDLCYPKKKGGISIRSLHTVSEALFANVVKFQNLHRFYIETLHVE